MSQVTFRGRNTYQPTTFIKSPFFPRLNLMIRGWTTGSYGGPFHPIYRTGKVGYTPVPLVRYPAGTASDQRVLLQGQPLKRVMEKVRKRRRVLGRGYMREFWKDVGKPRVL